MELTVYAQWLNEVFALFDSFVLGLHHELAVAHGSIITPIASVLDVAGHYGAMFLGLALILLFFRKTRMAGVAIIVAVAIAGGVSELVIKGIVARPRPFESSDTFRAWWEFVGSTPAHGTSFPSGHVTAATAFAIALSYAARRWYVSFLSILVVLAMMIDRMYLTVHYPSDVLAGFILGFVGGIIAYAIVQGIWRLMGKHPDQLADAKFRAAQHGGELQPGAYVAPPAPHAAAPANPNGVAAGYVPQQPVRASGGAHAKGRPAKVLDNDEIIFGKESRSIGYKTPQSPIRNDAAAGAPAEASPLRPSSNVDRDSDTGVMPAVDANKPKPGAYSASLEKPDQDESLTLEDFRRK